MATKVLWAAALLAYGASTGAAMDPPGASTSSSPSPLDMAPNSVDDMYNGCDVQMTNKAKEYLMNEMNTDAEFKEAWLESVKLFNQYNGNKITNMQFDIPTSGVLKSEEALAVYAYTSARGNLYEPFNEAVRTQGPRYATDFRFHALHYYLTRAVQKLQNANLLTRSKTCRSVSRRTKESFSHAKVNTQVRFGSFASCSKLSLQQTAHKAKLFGANTCFEIETCMGGNVYEYATYETEAEVLIPPYEAFVVTGVKNKNEKDDLPCEVVYTLKSTRQRVSNLNCSLI